MPAPNRNSIRYSVGCLLLGVTLLAACVSSCIWLANWADGEFEIATLRFDNNREIVITASRTWENSQPIYYFVRVDGEVVVPSTYIDKFNTNGVRFAKFASSDGNLVGITYADTPSEYLVIHDFSSNASFPRGDHIKWDSTLDPDENRNRHDRARAQLENKLNAFRER